jgi:hypothetical protein
MKIEIDTVKQITTRHYINLPEWIVFACNGQKISAIKSLRELARKDHDNNNLSLTQAKVIVESIMSDVNIQIIAEQNIYK